MQKTREKTIEIVLQYNYCIMTEAGEGSVSRYNFCIVTEAAGLGIVSQYTSCIVTRWDRRQGCIAIQPLYLRHGDGRWACWPCARKRALVERGAGA